MNNSIGTRFLTAKTNAPRKLLLESIVVISIFEDNERKNLQKSSFGQNTMWKGIRVIRKLD